MEPTGGAVQVEHVLDAARLSPYAVLVCVLTSLALVFDGFDIQAIAFAGPALLKEWGMVRADLASVLAAGLVGMGVGAVILGHFGDRYGRRRALLGCMAVIAVASLLSAYSSGRMELSGWRFLTGIGLGGALPNATALMVEFAPSRIRSLVVAVTVVGVPIGGTLGSAVASELVPRFGWRSIFVAGAILPGLLVLAMLRWLAESPRFLASLPERRAELAAVVNRVLGVNRYDGTVRWQTPPGGHSRPGVGALFAAEFRRDTLMLWLILFTNVLCVYSFFNWTPTLLTGVGLPLTTALRGALLFNLGGVFGALIGGYAITRVGSRPVLATLGSLSVASVFGLGLVPLGPTAPMAPFFCTVFFAGAAISGVQVQMYAVAAHAYPTRIRATGVGSALGIARIGGVLSSFAGSLLLGPSSAIWPFFAGIACVLLLTLTGIVLLRAHIPRPRTA